MGMDLFMVSIIVAVAVVFLYVRSINHDTKRYDGYGVELEHLTESVTNLTVRHERIAKEVFSHDSNLKILRTQVDDLLDVNEANGLPYPPPLPGTVKVSSKETVTVKMDKPIQVQIIEKPKRTYTRKKKVTKKKAVKKK